MINGLEKYIWQWRRRLWQCHALTEQKANYGQHECTTKFARRKISLSLEENWIKNNWDHSEKDITVALITQKHMQAPIISLGCENISYVSLNGHCLSNWSSNQMPFPLNKYKLLSLSGQKQTKKKVKCSQFNLFIEILYFWERERDPS